MPAVLPQAYGEHIHHGRRNDYAGSQADPEIAVRKEVRHRIDRQNGSNYRYREGAGADRDDWERFPFHRGSIAPAPV